MCGQDGSSGLRMDKETTDPSQAAHRLGAVIDRATEDDMVRIYGKPGAATLSIGSLHQFPDKTAYLKSEAFFSKNSAIVGTTGAGKSCALALILRTALKAHPHGHVLLLDPHGE